MAPVSLETIEQVQRTLIDLSLRYGARVVTAIALLSMGGIIARRIGRTAGRLFEKRELDIPLRTLFSRLLSAIVFLLFFMLALQNLGVELLPLFASLGVAGVGVGLAAQGVLGNLVAGLTIIFSRPFRVGEYVSMLGEQGRVEEITLMSTTLSHWDRSRVVVPNRKIVGEILHNYGKLRQLELSVSVAYATDLNKALAILRELLQRNPRILQEPMPIVGVVSLDDSSIKIDVKPWVAVADYLDAVAEINQAIVEQFRIHRIEIAFPQREIRILSGALSA